MACGDCAVLQPLLNFPFVSYFFCFVCFVLFRFVFFFFLTFDIFSGMHVRMYVQVATPLSEIHFPSFWDSIFLIFSNNFRPIL